MGNETSCSPDYCPTADVPSMNGLLGEGVLRVAPSPFSASTRVWYRVTDASVVQLEIFDAGGRLVHSAKSSGVPAGVHLIEWDGHTSRGNSAQPGVYFVRLSAGMRRWTWSVIRIR
jgi:hypothetical protein